MSTTATLSCCRRVGRKGREQLIFETAAGQRITLDETSATVSIEDTSGNQVRLTPTGIVIQTTAKLTINAASAEINASVLSVNAGMASFSGVVKADTLMANSVVASSYTPGAGNLM